MVYLHTGIIDIFSFRLKQFCQRQSYYPSKFAKTLEYTTNPTWQIWEFIMYSRPIPLEIILDGLEPLPRVLMLNTKKYLYAKHSWGLSQCYPRWGIVIQGYYSLVCSDSKTFSRVYLHKKQSHFTNLNGTSKVKIARVSLSWLEDIMFTGMATHIPTEAPTYSIMPAVWSFVHSGGGQFK